MRIIHYLTRCIGLDYIGLSAHSPSVIAGRASFARNDREEATRMAFHSVTIKK
jgi:hypothetical protein